MIGAISSFRIIRLRVVRRECRIFCPKFMNFCTLKALKCAWVELELSRTHTFLEDRYSNYYRRSGCCNGFCPVSLSLSFHKILDYPYWLSNSLLMYWDVGGPVVILVVCCRSSIELIVSYDWYVYHFVGQYWRIFELFTLDRLWSCCARKGLPVYWFVVGLECVQAKRCSVTFGIPPPHHLPVCRAPVLYLRVESIPPSCSWLLCCICTWPTSSCLGVFQVHVSCCETRSGPSCIWFYGCGRAGGWRRRRREVTSGMSGEEVYVCGFCIEFLYDLSFCL